MNATERHLQIHKTRWQTEHSIELCFIMKLLKHTWAKEFQEGMNSHKQREWGLNIKLNKILILKKGGVAV